MYLFSYSHKLNKLLQETYISFLCQILSQVHASSCTKLHTIQLCFYSVQITCTIKNLAQESM